MALSQFNYLPCHLESQTLANINVVLWGFPNLFTFVYLDDILVLTKSQQKHQVYGKQMLQRLLENSLSRQRSVSFM